MRPSITLTNTNKFGKVTNKWYVKIDKTWRVFGKEDFRDGIDWIKAKLGGNDG